MTSTSNISQISTNGVIDQNTQASRKVGVSIMTGKATIVTPAGVFIRAKPDAKSNKVGSLLLNQCVNVLGETTGADGDRWYQISKGYITGNSKWVTVVWDSQPGSSSVNENTDSANPVVKPIILSPPDPPAPITNESLKNDYWKYMRAMGCPPMYNKNIDLQYIDDVCPGCGRVFASTMFSNPSILSLCPGKVKYLPGFSSEKKANIKEMLLDAAKGKDFADRIAGDKNEILDGSLYDFEPDTVEYGNVLNLLCRTAAILMGIGNETMINSTNKFSTFDYTCWTYPSKYKMDPKANNLFTLAATLAADTATSDNNYMHYFIASGTSNVSEDISTATEKSVIEEALNGSSLDSMARNIQYLFGGVASDDPRLSGALGEIDAIMTAYSNQGNLLGKLGSGFSNYLKGGRMIFPQMMGEISYGKQLSAQLHFASPYGSKKSVFLYCIVPILSLLAMALPKQIADNMYTYPFIVRCYQKGWFNSDLAVISDIRIERGGTDDTAWTVEGLATEWDVTLTIQPLYSSLMTTSSRNPFLFMNNGALVEYLGNLCGVDIRMNSWDAKVEMAKAFIANYFTDIPVNIAKEVGTKLGNSVKNIFQWYA